MEKNVWRLIQGIGLWVHVIKLKHIALDIVEECIKKIVKEVYNISMMWKALINAFHLVGN